MIYEQTKYFLAVFLIGYALIGLFAHMTRTGTEDVYPFFSWFLFVNVPSRVQSGFDVRITSIKNELLDSPISALEKPDIFSLNGFRASDVDLLAQQLGSSLRGSDRAAIMSARAALESHFTTSTSYLVREFTYNPIEYFKNGAILSEKTLATFEVHK